MSAVDVSDYVDLITSEHADKPNFVATVALSCQPYVDQQRTALAMPGLYDLDVAVGNCLDAVGVWVGITRLTKEQITGVYFELDSAPLGLDLGYLQGPFDPTSGVVSLDDATYRVVLRARILANHWDGTLATAQADLAALFAGTPTPGTLLFITDDTHMHMTFAVAGQLPGPLVLALLAQNALGIKPVAVGVAYLQTSVNGAPLLGLGIDNSYISGLDVGAWGVPIT